MARRKGWQSGSRKVKHQGSMNKPKCVNTKQAHTATLQYSPVGVGSYRQMKSTAVILN